MDGFEILEKVKAFCTRIGGKLVEKHLNAGIHIVSCRLPETTISLNVTGRRLKILSKFGEEDFSFDKLDFYVIAWGAEYSGYNHEKNENEAYFHGRFSKLQVTYVEPKRRIGFILEGK